jgi:large subunit ribosomal protein L31
MKKDIHPEYHPVVFVDVSTGTEFVTRSTMTSDKTREVEGQQLPEIRVEISSASHPFFTGTMREIDTAGKIERFRRRYGQSKGK